MWRKIKGIRVFAQSFDPCLVSDGGGLWRENNRWPMPSALSTTLLVFFLERERLCKCMERERERILAWVLVFCVTMGIRICHS